MSYITAIGIANPKNKFNQSAIAEFMVRAMQLDENEARKLKALYRATGIETRYSVLEDYGKRENFNFYSNTENLEPFPSTSKRLEFFRPHAIGHKQTRQTQRWRRQAFDTTCSAEYAGLEPWRRHRYPQPAQNISSCLHNDLENYFVPSRRRGAFFTGAWLSLTAASACVFRNGVLITISRISVRVW